MYETETPATAYIDINKHARNDSWVDQPVELVTTAMALMNNGADNRISNGAGKPCANASSRSGPVDDAAYFDSSPT